MVQVTVTYLGVPVVALDAGVARTPVGAIAMGLGVRLGGYTAYRAGGRTGNEALEIHDARGELIPTTALRLAPTPFGRVVVFVHFRDVLAGVPARLEHARRGATTAERSQSGADADTEPTNPPRPRRSGEGSSASAT
jgi:hypothetical protein